MITPSIAGLRFSARSLIAHFSANFRVCLAQLQQRHQHPPWSHPCPVCAGSNATRHALRKELRPSAIWIYTLLMINNILDAILDVLSRSEVSLFEQGVPCSYRMRSLISRWVRLIGHSSQRNERIDRDRSQLISIHHNIGGYCFRNVRLPNVLDELPKISTPRSDSRTMRRARCRNVRILWTVFVDAASVSKSIDFRCSSLCNGVMDRGSFRTGNGLRFVCSRRRASSSFKLGSNAQQDRMVLDSRSRLDDCWSAFRAFRETWKRTVNATTETSKQRKGDSSTVS